MAAAVPTPDPVTLMALWGRMEDFDPNADSGFEGPEKRLEIIVHFDDEEGNNLRDLDQSVWEEVVGSLNAKIVSKISNDHIDSMVLTESSLFVTKNRIVLITCGTTTLLVSVPIILKYINSIGGTVEWASFMRKNYSFPWAQIGPHSSLEAETSALEQQFPGGAAFIFGPVDSDHYFLYVLDNIKRPCIENDTQVSMTMYGLNPKVASIFFSDAFHSTSQETEEIRRKSRIGELVNDWDVQDLQFEPCGYSINAISGKEYQTMHITPEEKFSFASYETNSPLDNFSDRIKNVLSVFGPQRFTVIVMIDPQSPVGLAHETHKAIGVEPEALGGEYSLVNRTINQFGPGYVAMKLNYVKHGDPLEEQK